MSPERTPLDCTPLMVAHGTRSAAGVSTIAAIAEQVAERIGPTRVAFVDVLGPTPSEVLAEVDGPAVVVPAFLASGYHVRVDMPRHIERSGHRRVATTPALGPDPVIAGVLAQRLTDAGWRPGDQVVLGAAGSSDADARADVARAAGLLADRIGARVEVGFLTATGPDVSEVVANARSRRGGRVVVASYLLAPGHFQTRLADCGADVVTEPLGADPAIVELVTTRMWSGARMSGCVR